MKALETVFATPGLTVAARRPKLDVLDERIVDLLQAIGIPYAFGAGEAGLEPDQG